MQEYEVITTKDGCLLRFELNLSLHKPKVSEDHDTTQECIWQMREENKKYKVRILAILHVSGRLSAQADGMSTRQLSFIHIIILRAPSSAG